MADIISIIVTTCNREDALDAVLRSLAREFLALGDDEPAHAIVRRHAEELSQVAVNDPGILLDVDTPEDYQRALALYRPAASPGSASV